MVVDQHNVSLALYISTGITTLVLLFFGYGKTALTIRGGWGWGKGGKGWECLKGTAECVFVVAASAGLSVIIIRAIDGTL